MDIGNIHTMRHSLEALDAAVVAIAGTEDHWLPLVHSSQWLLHLSSVLSAAYLTARLVEQGRSVLVHCSDGWDRTAQLTSLSQLLLDPYYRTMEGFLVLVDKEWLAFGHKCHDRLNNPQKPGEASPVFVQWLDCVFQVLRQFPMAFEFTSGCLEAIYNHVHSGFFGTFTLNCEAERVAHNLAAAPMFGMWQYMRHPANQATWRYPGYVPTSKVLRILSSVKCLTLWKSLYLRYDEVYHHDIGDHEELALSDSDVEDNVTTGGDGTMDRNGFPAESATTPRSDGDAKEANSPARQRIARRHEPQHGQSPQEKKATLRKVIWQPDNWTNICGSCARKFTLLRRKHHCRQCGKIFCSACCSNYMDVEGVGSGVRVCLTCYEPPTEAIA